MDPSIKNLLPGDPKLIENIVSQLKSQGIFDEFRRDCLADVDTKPAYQNLQHRVENFASDFLKSTQWRPDLNKNQLRDGLRRHINESGMLTTGVDRIIDQIVNPKIIQIFFPKITEIVRKIFGIDTSSQSQGSPSDDFGSESAFSKPLVVPSDNSNGSTESKTVLVKQEPLAAVPDVPHGVTNKLESSPYIDAIEEQLLVLTGAHEYIKLEQLHNSPTSEPACKSSSGASRERIPNAEKDGEAKRDKGKEDSSRKSDNAGKPPKKVDAKTVIKGKPSTFDKPKISLSEKKPEKTIKREHSPSKTVSGVKGAEGKSIKQDDKKGSTKMSSEKSKSKSELPRHDDSLQKAKKLPDSKEGTDCSIKTHKPLVKSKSFEEKDGSKPKLEKSTKTDKVRDELERPKGSQSADKLDKSKDGGKLRVSESSKHRSEKTKSPDKKPESSSSKHKSRQSDKSRHHHHDKSKSLDKKFNPGSSHTKGKDADKGNPKSIKFLGFGDKLCEADKSTLVSKPKTVAKPLPFDRDDKAKGKKEQGKAKSDQKSKYSTSGTLLSARPDKVSVRKPTLEGSSAANKAETAIKDGSSSNKVLKRQFSASPDTSMASKKPKQDDKQKSEIKTTKNVQSSPPKNQSSTSDSYSSSDDEEFREFDASDVVSPTKIREDILKKVSVDGDDRLSDVTVSSVHTSDLSDFDDRITLSESEEERAQSITPRKKARSIPSSQEEPKVAEPLELVARAPVSVAENYKEEAEETAGCEVTQKVHGQVFEAEKQEPRRELRRQRKLNPRYTSDDFSSIFNTGKDRQNHGHIFEHVAEDLHREIPEMQSRGRRSTGHSTTTDDTEFPGSPISDVSELGELSKAKRGGRGKLCSPSESSDGDHSGKGPRSISSEVNEGEDFRPRTSSQHSGSGRKGKQERLSPVEPIVSPRSDANGRRNNKAENASESPSIPKRTPARYDNQRYSSTDLYKPRPVFTSSRRRTSSPSKPNPNLSYSDFGPLVIDESAGETQQQCERSNKQYAQGQQSSQGKRRQSKKSPSSASKRRR